MKLSANLTNTLIKFISNFDSNEIDRIAVNNNLPRREIDQSFEGFCDTLETNFTYLSRILTSFVKIKTFIEDFFDPVNWVNNQHYSDWILTLNKILFFSMLTYDVEKNKIVKLARSNYIKPDILEYLQTINKLDDYKNMLYCHDHNLNVASILYIRRILEELVYQTKPELRKQNIHSFDVLYSKAKENFSLEVQKHISSNYSVMSEFVHSLKEEEAKKYFDPLKLIIDIEINHRIYGNNLPLKTQQNIEKLSTKMFNQIKGYDK